jgi:DNA repair protein RecN (Recombination protein N)
MLTHIHIRDFAIIEELELSLGRGLCVLTGETGAGKSILIDALGLVLGDRAESHTVRHSAAKADLAIGVHIGDLPQVIRWLEERDLHLGDECLLRRVVTREGRSRAYINGVPTPLATVRTLGEMLVDVHGQHEHQSLLRRDSQRRLLDEHGGNAARLAELARVYEQWRDLGRRLEALSSAQDEREGRRELLRYQLRELTDLGLGQEEASELESEHQRLAHVGQLKSGALELYHTLYEAEDGAVHTLLATLCARLDALADTDPALGEYHELLQGAQIQVEEAADGLRRYAERLELDPRRLEWVEARLATVHELARKHRVAPGQLPSRQGELERELVALEDPEQDLERMQEASGALEARYTELAQEIGETRRRTAQRLSAQVTDAMQGLGLQGGEFRIEVQTPGQAQPSRSGWEHIDFLVSANPGQPRRSLSKVASGGELSRISLAIQMVAANSLHIPTLIFDEVDVGIGGAVAETVGRHLRALGGRRQVLCVTHLAQVAAQAHHHYQVRKTTRRSTTLTHIATLSTQARVEEIARMLGGVEMTEQTRAHALEMITRAQVP